MALGVDTGDYLTPARLLVPVGMYPDLDRWCPDCGAVRIWKGNANRPTWLRPGEGDVGKGAAVKRVLLDVDGVIADFIGGFRERAERICGRLMPDTCAEWDICKAWGLTPEEQSAVWLSMDRPGVAASLQPLPGAVAGVVELACTADVYFVTSPVWSSPTWSHDRERWLINLFGKELGSKCVHTRHKHLVAGDALVDDKPSNVNSWRRAHPAGHGFIWHASYNTGEGGPRLYGWNELIELVDCIHGRTDG